MSNMTQSTQVGLRFPVPLLERVDRLVAQLQAKPLNFATRTDVILFLVEAGLEVAEKQAGTKEAPPTLEQELAAQEFDEALVDFLDRIPMEHWIAVEGVREALSAAYNGDVQLLIEQRRAAKEVGS